MQYRKFSIYKGVGDEISRSSHTVSLIGNGNDFETNESFCIFFFFWMKCKLYIYEIQKYKYSGDTQGVTKSSSYKSNKHR